MSTHNTLSALLAWVDAIGPDRLISWVVTTTQPREPLWVPVPIWHPREFEERRYQCIDESQCVAATLYIAEVLWRHVAWVECDGGDREIVHLGDAPPDDPTALIDEWWRARAGESVQIYSFGVRHCRADLPLQEGEET